MRTTYPFTARRGRTLPSSGIARKRVRGVVTTNVKTVRYAAEKDRHNPRRGGPCDSPKQILYFATQGGRKADQRQDRAISSQLDKRGSLTNELVSLEADKRE